ncbi:ferredoxin Fer [Halosegnis marinus]|uniref:Ferredoxin Fer n=1 Tax=Halosegnis marinus TaxID=3034023 RepID=A0ABD5ZMR5_9EURY|nr:ferredoxin Fer [Halosegnis sp. DT85]
MDSPFDVLGVERDADPEAIERAYRERVKDAHPDHGGSAREFQRVRRAYEAIVSGDEEALVAAEEDARDDGRTSDTATRARARNRTPSDDGADADDGPSVEGSRVEFLNYEVLDDHGWELTDDDLFEKAAGADLDTEDYGRLLVKPGENLLEAAENRGFVWPYACRGGACSNCAVALVEGEMPTPAGNILTDEWLDRDIRLSCISSPVSDEAKVVYNVKHLPGLDDLRLRPSRFDARMQD